MDNNEKKTRKIIVNQMPTIIKPTVDSCLEDVLFIASGELSRYKTKVISKTALTLDDTRAFGILGRTIIDAKKAEVKDEEGLEDISDDQLKEMAKKMIED